MMAFKMGYEFSKVIIAVLLIGIQNKYVLADEENEQELYQQNCSFCHGDDATGEMPGVPDLIAQRGWMLKSDEQLLLTLIAGVINENGVSMPSRGGNMELTDDQLHELQDALNQKTAKKKRGK